MGLHGRQRLVSHVEAGEDAERVHLRARRRTDAVEFADRKGFDEGGPISGVMTYWPFGLRWSEASFARNLL